VARDLYLGSFIVGLFDTGFAIRAAGKRFAFINVPLKFILQPFGVNEAAVNNRKLDKVLGHAPAGASQIEVVSGFLVREESFKEGRPQAAAPVKIYVNLVLLKASDALIVHWLGLERGRAGFELLQSPVGQSIWLALLLPSAAALIAMPFVASDLVFLVAMPFPFYHLAREMLTNSRTMVRLLYRRRVLLVQLAFVAIWLVAFCLCFSDQQIWLAIGFVSLAVGEMFKDASVRAPLRHARVKNKLLLGLAFLILAAQLVWATFALGSDPLVNFRPDLASENSTVAYSDRGNVVDVRQQLVDLSLALGTGHLALAFHLLAYSPPDELVCAFIIISQLGWILTRSSSPRRTQIQQTIVIPVTAEWVV